MIRSTKIYSAYLCVLAALLTFTACEKDGLDNGAQATNAKQEAIAFSMNTSISGSLTSQDSLYVMEGCKRGNKKEASSFETLPASIRTYLSASYSGYTTIKAFKIINNTTANTDSFITIILFNGKPVALKFDAEGTFVKVMELREGRDLNGLGWHLGGLFEHRDGKGRDTVAVENLPSAIKLYFTTHYSSETLLYAVKSREGSILVMSNDTNGFYGSAFTSTGAFIKRVYLPVIQGKSQAIAATELPASAQGYLSGTFPGFVYQRAFEISVNGSLKGYLTLIDANMTKYAVLFDTSGQMISTVTVR